MMWLMLSKYKVQAACTVLLILLAWSLGFGMAKSLYQNKINVLEMEYAKQNAQREQQYVHELQAMLAEKQKWQDFAQQQGVQLAQAQQKLDIQAAQIHRDNHDAIQKDNSGNQHFNGIGTYSLRQYNRAFGYTN